MNHVLPDILQFVLTERFMEELNCSKLLVMITVIQNNWEDKRRTYEDSKMTHIKSSG